MPRVDRERERGERVDELLDALEAIPQAHREQHLISICPDPELRHEVLALLAVEPEAGVYLDRLSDRLVPRRPSAAGLEGKSIGPYRLLRPLGRGGMGVVYEAERADGAFDQRVALKLLTTALAGTEARERFLAERQILAGLQHPSIAHIVDGGITEDGTPWFAMEHVEGEEIDAYCDRRRLGIRERLTLFLQICDAVDHAHRRLVVHRDLKPANVLVTGDDAPVGRGETRPTKENGGAPPRAKPRVKLLDFGIAKLLDPGGTATAALPTRTALRLMTPEYASPEQVRGEAVTTASDVYQLGLLLYELLTGRRPYTLRRRGAGQLERAICEQMPARLNTVLSRKDTGRALTDVPTPSVEEICRARRSTPARLRRSLRGDLETIVLRALRKEPEQRYGSADRLAQDVRRHLAGLPVAARASTWIYRGRKFLERHALGASATAIVVCLAVGLTAFHTARIQSERDRAQQMSQFLAGLFRSVDPRQAQGAEIAARDLLDRGVEQVDRELTAQPEIQAEILQVLGSTYLELGLHESAERLLTRALELHRRRDGSEHRNVAKVVAELGRLRYEQGEYTRAREDLQQAIRIFETSPGRDASELSAVLSELGQTYRRLGEYERGFAALDRALALQVEASGGDTRSAAAILNRQGALLFEIGALERAESLYSRALAIHERELGADHPLVGGTLADLANVRAARGNLDGLETMYRRNLAIQRNAYGPVHARVGSALNNLGQFLIALGRNDEAIEVLEDALDVQGAALGPDHPRVAFPLDGLGEAHLASGRVSEARSYFQRSVTVREEALGTRPFDPVLAHGLVRLGRIEADLGNRAAANRHLDRVLTIWREAPQRVHPVTASSFRDLARLLAAQQRCSDALPLLRRVHRTEIARRNATSVAELERLLAGCS